MAECLGMLHFLIPVLALNLLSEKGLCQYMKDVAREKEAFQSSVANGFHPSRAVDGLNETCSLTSKEEEPFWMVDLGAEHTVNLIKINTGDEHLQYSRLFVSNSRTQLGRSCSIYYPSDFVSYTEIRCGSPLKGRYITIKAGRWQADLQLCDVKVMECLDNYFGRNCSKECHCMERAQCDKVTGQCPNNCALGWMGEGCQESCPPGRFGFLCESECHCQSGALCTSEHGICPADCEEDFLGNDCQTELPSMGNDRPFMISKGKNWITVQWVSWMGNRGEGVDLFYSVFYKPHELHGSHHDWQSVILPHRETTSNYQRTTLSNLTINTNYMVQINANVRIDGENNWGSPTEVVGPFRTDCDNPEAPDVEGVEYSVDEKQDPPAVVLTVRWIAPKKSQVHCDNVKFYEISYQASNSEAWVTELAGGSSDVQNITGLTFATQYKITVSTVNNGNLKGTSGVIVYKTPDNHHSSFVGKRKTSTGVVAGILIGIMVILAAILAFVFYRRRKKKYAAVPDKEEKPDETPILNNIVKVDLPPINTDLDDSGVQVDGSGSEATPSSVADTLDSNGESDKPIEPPPGVDKTVRVEDLEEYVLARRDNDCEAVRKEYEEIPMGFHAKYEHGKRNENKHKNRFVNIIAYDHSRVKLDESPPGDPYSDYINANYIDGYKKPGHYIAAQGCNKYTLQDMWRMVWQLNSGRIIMATNLVENGKRKCDQYWPSNGTKMYGDVNVKLTDTEQTSDFIIRTFELTKDEELRECKQFHFVAWPDHGVPTRAGPILAFRRKVRSYDETHPGPMVIHCSAGVGRTGTFIALDYLLEQAKAENTVDVYGIVWKMRKDRVNMIQTVEQYIFVYDALLEALKAGNTCIGCSNFREEYSKLCALDPVTNKSKLQEQFETLQLMSPKVKAEDCKSGLLAENEDKNRCPDILPADRHRPYLMIRVEGTNDYINAIFLDGYRKRNSYIITQMPMPHTVIDFWRMLYEHNCHSVVMLNSLDSEDETYGQYWLEEEVCDCGPFVIEPVSVDTTNNNITIRELKLTYEPQSPSLLPAKRKEQPRQIAQFQLNCWPDGSSTPTSKSALVTLIELVERQQQKTGDGPVVIHCRDGVSFSGLYAAVSCILEKMKLEQEVDIFHIVKHLRYHRPQIINDLEQYQFCFEMVLAYLAEFDTYANFR